MAFRRKGTESQAGDCWCGAEAVSVSGTDTDSKPWSYTTCTADIFHDPSTGPAGLPTGADLDDWLDD